MLPTNTLSTVVNSPDGTPVVGARMIAKLDRADFTPSGTVFPERVASISDENGNVSLDLVPNLIGTQNSLYEVQIIHPDNWVSVDVVIQMPDANVTLESLVGVIPIPPNYDTAAAISAAQAAQSAIESEAFALASEQAAQQAAQSAEDAGDILLDVEAVLEDAELAAQASAQSAADSSQSAGDSLQYSQNAQQSAEQAEDNANATEGAVERINLLFWLGV